jgi:murein DD-endopeptidase MepM/ murein hydrolase activator NlpD
MNQNRNSIVVHSFLARAALLSGGVAWFSGICLFSATAGSAQPFPQPTVPGAEDLLGADLHLSSPSQVPAAIEPEASSSIPLAPAENLTPTAAEELPAIVPAQPAAVEAAPEPTDSADLIAPDLAKEAVEAFGGGEYIDPTPYSLGATQKPDVVVTERSTGCQTVLAPGQDVPTTLCPPSAVAAGSSQADGVGSYDPTAMTVYQLEPETASARDFYNLTVRPPARLSNNNISLLFPLSIPAAITSAFGWRVHPIMSQMRFHSGTDIGAPQGTPVLAAFGGKVEIADFVGGYGLTIVLQHNKGAEQTLYAHLSELFVQPGEDVKQGEVIGRVGSTGLSTGPHLHFEFRKQTQEGWVVMDAGSALEQGMAQLVRSLQVAQVNPKVPAFR